MADKYEDDVSGVAVVTSVIGDWTAYTPSTGNSGFDGSATFSGFWRQVGSSMEIRAQGKFAGAGTGTLAIGLPIGYTIDESKLTGTTGDRALIGDVQFYDVSVPAAYTGSATYVIGTAGPRFYGSNGVALWTTSIPVVAAVGDIITMHLTIPITGWSATVAYGAGQATATTPGISSGNVGYPGNNTGTAPGVGKIGERINGTNIGATLSTSGNAFNTYSVVLTTGTWIVYGKLSATAGGTTQTTFQVSLSNTSATENAVTLVRDSGTALQTKYLAPSAYYYSGTGTTVYMVGNSTFTGTAPAVQTGSSELYAIRIA